MAITCYGNDKQNNYLVSVQSSFRLSEATNFIIIGDTVFLFDATK